MLFSSSTQTQLGFPQPLTEKHRPRSIRDFVGLDKPKKVIAKFADAPMPCSFLFVGSSGTGKTSMALALAEVIRAEVHHLPSGKCNAEAIDNVVRQCWYAPMNEGFTEQYSRRGQLPTSRAACRMTLALVLTVGRLAVILGQLFYHLILKRETAELSDATWNACLLR